MPDAWHHQMVFGAAPRGVFLCNPVECVRETMLWPRLASPSALLVRAGDVVDRFTNTTDLTPLLHVPDERFETYNVLGKFSLLIATDLTPFQRMPHARFDACNVLGKF